MQSYICSSVNNLHVRLTCVSLIWPTVAYCILILTPKSVLLLAINLIDSILLWKENCSDAILFFAFKFFYLPLIGDDYNFRESSNWCKLKRSVQSFLSKYRVSLVSFCERKNVSLGYAMQHSLSKQIKKIYTSMFTPTFKEVRVSHFVIM